MAVPFPRYWLLNNGFRMPNLGLGTYMNKGDKVKEAVDCALSVGYRHIDTARIYENEHDIGDVLHSRLRSGSVKRKDLFITTKIAPVYLAPKDVRQCLEASLADLRLTYVDMLLIHTPFGLRNHGDGNLRPTDEKGNPDYFRHDLVSTWRALESLCSQRLTRSIGLSNFTAKQINRIWYHARIKPSNLQLECHAYNQQTELLHYCEARDIKVTGYAPLGCPDLPEDKRDSRILPHLLSDPVVTDVADSINKTNSQILLRYLLQLGVAPLPKATSKSHIEENMQVYNFELDIDDMSKLATLHRNTKFFNFFMAKSHPEYSSSEAF